MLSFRTASSRPEIVACWFVGLCSGDFQTRRISNAVINNREATNESQKISETDYGKSIRAVMQIRNVPNNTRIRAQLYDYDFPDFDDRIGGGVYFEGRVRDNRVIIPLYLKPEWYNAESERDEKHELYFKARTTSMIGDDYLEKEMEDPIQAWKQPWLHIECDNYITSFYPGSGRRALPSSWNNEPESDKRYWPRLGRAYSGLGVRGHEIITWRYHRRGKITTNIFTVSNINWRGNAGSSGNQNDFEHPSPNREDSAVVYKNRTSVLQFWVDHSELGVWVHKGRNVEGCIALGSGTDCNELMI
jgi:hypothetical protein